LFEDNALMVSVDGCLPPRLCPEPDMPRMPSLLPEDPHRGHRQPRQVWPPRSAGSG